MSSATSPPGSIACTGGWGICSSTASIRKRSSGRRTCRTVRYLPLNPVRCGLVRDPAEWEWEWGSYRATASLSPSRGAGTARGWVRNRTSGQVPAPLRGAAEFLFARSPGVRPLRGLHPRLSASAPSALPPPAAARKNDRGPSGPRRAFARVRREGGGPHAGPAVFASLDAPATFWHRSAVRILPVATFRSFSSRAIRGFDRFAAFTPGYRPARLRRFLRQGRVRVLRAHLRIWRGE
jgi:hypothetical protein